MTDEPTTSPPVQYSRDWGWIGVLVGFIAFSVFLVFQTERAFMASAIVTAGCVWGLSHALRSPKWFIIDYSSGEDEVLQFETEADAWAAISEIENRRR